MSRGNNKSTDVTSGENVMSHRYDSGNKYSTLGASTTSGFVEARYISAETHVVSSTPHIRMQNDIYKLNQELKKLGK